MDRWVVSDWMHPSNCGRVFIETDKEDLVSALKEIMERRSEFALEEIDFIPQGRLKTSRFHAYVGKPIRCIFHLVYVIAVRILISPFGVLYHSAACCVHLVKWIVSARIRESEKASSHILAFFVDGLASVLAGTLVFSGFDFFLCCAMCINTEKIGKKSSEKRIAEIFYNHFGICLRRTGGLLPYCSHESEKISDYIYHHLLTSLAKKRSDVFIAINEKLIIGAEEFLAGETHEIACEAPLAFSKETKRALVDSRLDFSEEIRSLERLEYQINILRDGLGTIRFYNQEGEEYRNTVPSLLTDTYRSEYRRNRARLRRLTFFEARA